MHMRQTRLALSAYHLLSLPAEHSPIRLHTCTYMHSLRQRRSSANAQMYKRALRLALSAHHLLSLPAELSQNFPHCCTPHPLTTPHTPFLNTPHESPHTTLSHTTQYLQRPPSAGNLHAITLPPHKHPLNTSKTHPCTRFTHFPPFKNPLVALFTLQPPTRRYTYTPALTTHTRLLTPHSSHTNHTKCPPSNHTLPQHTPT